MRSNVAGDCQYSDVHADSKEFPVVRDTMLSKCPMRQSLGFPASLYYCHKLNYKWSRHPRGEELRNSGFNINCPPDL